MTHAVQANLQSVPPVRRPAPHTAAQHTECWEEPPGIQIVEWSLRGDTFLKKLINFGHCPKRGGGPAMSEVLYKISDDNKFAYFTSSHDKEVNIGEQNHQNQKLSAGSDMDF